MLWVTRDPSRKGAEIHSVGELLQRSHGRPIVDVAAGYIMTGDGIVQPAENGFADVSDAVALCAGVNPLVMTAKGEIRTKKATLARFARDPAVAMSCSARDNTIVLTRSGTVCTFPRHTDTPQPVTEFQKKQIKVVSG